MEAYERFFDLYDKKLLCCDDESLQSRILSTLLFNLGNLHTVAGDQDLAVDFLTEALTSLKKIETEKGEYSKDICITLNEIGLAKFACRQYEEALRYFAEILSLHQLHEDMHDTLSTAKVLNNVGCVYFALKELKPGLEAFSESLEVSRSFLIEKFMGKVKDSMEEEPDSIKAALLSVAQTIGNIAHVKSSHGCRHEAKLLLKEALSILDKLSSSGSEEVKQIEEIISSLSIVEV